MGRSSGPESTLGRLRCPHCGFRSRRVRDRRDKKVRDLEVSGRPTTLVWSRRRMACDNRFFQQADSQLVWPGYRIQASRPKRSHTGSVCPASGYRVAELEAGGVSRCRTGLRAYGFRNTVHGYEVS